MQNLILSVMNELDLAALNDEKILKEERELLNTVYARNHLSEVEEVLVAFSTGWRSIPGREGQLL